MEAPQTFSEALTELKTLTSQTNNFTFTDDELTQALTEAWMNTYVCKRVTDNSLTYSASVFEYTKPATLDVVTSISIQYTTTEPKKPLDRSLYIFPDDTTIRFTSESPRWLSDGLTLYITGRKKLTTSDSLSTDSLVNYVISLAAFQLLKRLALKAAFQFLKNDTSLQEIIALRNAFQTDVLTYKQALQREYEAI